MLDNLRDDAAASPFFDDDDELPDFLEEDEEEVEQSGSNPFAFLQPVLDLTPVQRFIIAAMLFTMVCLIGSMFLIVTGRVSIF